MRSYNRPQYLQESLASISKSDMAKYCSRCIIYDDASTDVWVREILDSYKDTYEILMHETNLQQKSMVAFLNYIQNMIDPNTYDHICYLDNDATVHKNWVSVCMNTYKKIQWERKLASDKFILTGFNTAAHRITKVHKGYVEKKSIGGIHMYFHRNMLDKIRNWWDINQDWGVVHGLKKEGGRMYCCFPGVVQHIGQRGNNSRPNMYDKAV